MAPNHCLGSRTLPNKMTDVSTVKNFLVVVTTEQGSGPNSATCKNTLIGELNKTNISKYNG